ncbi:response regulator [Rhizobium sp. BK399]|uniref:response regulator n=1 Tax=Rhizobium sp. BK399 TaxID=2587063 RepID=UPI0018497662|nr:CheY-like chemotaxis protein [Rhizobium sp. BK399]
MSSRSEPLPRPSATVLVVEDEPLLRLAIVANLQDEGFTVLEASGAAAAIGIIENHPEITLLFTDIDMPGTMDGLLLAAFVRVGGHQSKSSSHRGIVSPIVASFPSARLS